jgi:hypothetical protein
MDTSADFYTVEFEAAPQTLVELLDGQAKLYLGNLEFSAFYLFMVAMLESLSLSARFDQVHYCSRRSDRRNVS